MKSGHSSLIIYRKPTTFGICVVLSSQITFGQIKIKDVPDPVPAKETFLLSGKLDSSQYFYFPDGILKEQFDDRSETLR